jgi:foldase protein PrsA
MTEVALSSDPVARGPHRPRSGAYGFKRHARRGAACGVLVLAVALSGCGGGTSHNTASGASSTSTTGTVSVANPSEVVVRVGSNVITKARFLHELLVLGRREGPVAGVPVPPAFAGCIGYLKSSGSKPASDAALKKQCSERYATLEARALRKLILPDWVVGAAAEGGITVSEQEVLKQLKKEEDQEPSVASFERTLAVTGRTVADQAQVIKVQLLEEAIRQSIREKTGHVTQAQVLAYYNRHKTNFAIPQQRDLEIARTSNKAEGESVKRKIASGQSFASVIKKLPLQQPIFSTDGLVMKYESGMYAEKPLNDAIFAAPVNALRGPVAIYLGYYVFRVTRIYPAVQKTFAESKATIKAQLPAELYEQAIASYISAWRKTWTAKTNCEPGYVVAKCSQFKTTPGAEAEDPYTFD